MVSRRLLGRGALIALAVLFIGLTVLAGWLLRGWRIDLTENSLYTIAPGTKRILATLPEPVNLYYFWSGDAASAFPQLKSYGDRVQEFLEELAARSDGNLRLTVIDPEPFSEDEDRAAEFGVRGVPLGQRGETLYFGLAGTNATDGREAIPFFDPSKEAFLEYDVAKLIYQLGRTERPVVAWLSSLPLTGSFDPMTGQPGEPWFVYAQAEQLFDTRQLAPSITEIAPDVDVLVLVHPKSLPLPAQFAIDQFALRGGRLLLLLDPVAEQDPAGTDPMGGPPPPGVGRSSELATLLASWGVDFEREAVIGDQSYGLTVTMRPGEPPVRHLGILGLDETSHAGEDIVTSGLGTINVATIGAVSPRQGATTQFVPLLQSSTLAGVIPASRFDILMDPATLQDGFKASGQRYTIAARVTGPFKTAFPGGAPAGVALPDGVKALSASAQPLNLIVVADSDLLADYLWLRDAPASFFGPRAKQAWAHNGDFIWNALDNLAGSDDLISVRGRATFTRPFDRVEDLRRAAEGRFRAKEQELEAELAATEEKLTGLQGERAEAAGGVILSAEQLEELERFRAEQVRLRRELRDVRLGLDQEIRGLGNRLKLVNIVLVPAIFAALALLVAVWRRKRQAAIRLVQKVALP
jgi:ABC-type uncharacterized transport system involved in gliding motility auxiliary subunit